MRRANCACASNSPGPARFAPRLHLRGGVGGTINRTASIGARRPPRDQPDFSRAWNNLVVRYTNCRYRTCASSLPNFRALAPSHPAMIEQTATGWQEEHTRLRRRHADCRHHAAASRLQHGSASPCPSDGLTWASWLSEPTSTVVQHLAVPTCNTLVSGDRQHQTPGRRTPRSTSLESRWTVQLSASRLYAQAAADHLSRCHSPRGLSSKLGVRETTQSHSGSLLKPNKG